jgi:hypothetical protein
MTGTEYMVTIQLAGIHRSDGCAVIVVAPDGISEVVLSGLGVAEAVRLADRVRSRLDAGEHVDGIRLSLGDREASA